eukprot:Cvel_2758.t1-p1 / transcript=Cvel_2758.t1 / gene=Cvel_2758 / organism=Chromera_velia_CCMP2878 / gene_product=hypothetical protein / transcript_product=hypothetical protein / location=Cvel_scaffold111:1-1278(-) / protein_length=236 / sequence_SO=supercontig / SO=protein_coding / is_pseudo=false
MDLSKSSPEDGQSAAVGDGERQGKSPPAPLKMEAGGETGETELVISHPVAVTAEKKIESEDEWKRLMEVHKARTMIPPAFAKSKDLVHEFGADLDRLKAALELLVFKPGDGKEVPPSELPALVAPLLEAVVSPEHAHKVNSLYSFHPQVAGPVWRPPATGRGLPSRTVSVSQTHPPEAGGGQRPVQTPMSSPRGLGDDPSAHGGASGVEADRERLRMELVKAGVSSSGEAAGGGGG